MNIDSRTALEREYDKKGAIMTSPYLHQLIKILKDERDCAINNWKIMERAYKECDRKLKEKEPFLPLRD